MTPNVVPYDTLVAQGFTFVEAIAAAPPGWTRDERGRVFQTEFDMNRRFWLGGGWEPTFLQQNGGSAGRAFIETGLRGETLTGDKRQRIRFHAVTGQLALNPLELHVTAFSLDSSSNSGEPFYRFTTFWPKPERHDVFLDVGGWLEVMTIDFRPRQLKRELHLRFVGAGPTLDLWHSRGMASFVRLRAGGAFDDLRQNGDDGHDHLALTPLAALETDLTFDRAGMHRLTIGSQYELPLVWRDGGKEPPTVTQRFMNTIAYEPILLAINDQPVSLRLSASGGYRSDLPEPHRGWDVRGGIGLRVNFWAPAPRTEDAFPLERPQGE